MRYFVVGVGAGRLLRATFSGKRLTAARGIYDALAELSNDRHASIRGSEFRQTRAEVARHAGVSDRTLDFYAREFVRIGLLQVVRPRGGHSGNTWRLLQVEGDARGEPARGEANSTPGPARGEANSTPIENEELSEEAAAAARELAARGIDNPRELLERCSPAGALGACRWFDEKRGVGPGLLAKLVLEGGKPGYREIADGSNVVPFRGRMAPGPRRDARDERRDRRGNALDELRKMNEGGA